MLRLLQAQPVQRIRSQPQATVRHPRDSYLDSMNASTSIHLCRVDDENHHRAIDDSHVHRCPWIHVEDADHNPILSCT